MSTASSPKAPLTLNGPDATWNATSLMNTVDLASLLASGTPARTPSSLSSSHVSAQHTHAFANLYTTHTHMSPTQWSNTSNSKTLFSSFFPFFFFYSFQLLLLFHHPCTRSSRQRSQNLDSKSDSQSSQLIGIVTNIQFFPFVL